jgi:hypothetical protein
LFERVSIPALLLGAIYSAYGTVLVVNQALNDRRDLIINVSTKAEKPLSVAQGWLIYSDDFAPMLVGLIVFISVYCLILERIPSFVTQDPLLRQQVNKLKWLCMMLPLTGLIGFVIGGWEDVVKITHYLTARAHPDISALPMQVAKENDAVYGTIVRELLGSIIVNTTPGSDLCDAKLVLCRAPFRKEEMVVGQSAARRMYIVRKLPDAQANALLSYLRPPTAAARPKAPGTN